MLDFVKAMEIAKRMCTGRNCDKCPILDGINCALTKNPCCDIDWPEVERRLIEWDKAHPEPQFPTWEEWQRENFPGATHNICPRAFAPKEMWICGSKDCNDCMCEAIPADIAKKLGIQPIDQQEK